MKKKLVMAASLAVFIFLANGCIPSIHPIYTEETLVLVKELPGTYESENHEKWEFKEGEGKNYLLIHKDDKGNLATFDIHLVRLAGQLFMDFYPASLPEEMKPDKTESDSFGFSGDINYLREMHLMPVHTFARLDLNGGNLTINMFNPDFMDNLLEQQPNIIKHEEVDGGMILTASPEDLQRFIGKYATEKEAFMKNSSELSRVY